MRVKLGEVRLPRMGLRSSLLDKFTIMPDQDHVVAEMVSTLGHLPKRWWDRQPQRTDF
jgi:hypothetical protein